MYFMLPKQAYSAQVPVFLLFLESYMATHKNVFTASGFISG